MKEPLAKRDLYAVGIIIVAVALVAVFLYGLFDVARTLIP